MSHIADTHRYAPPYKSWTRCGELVSTKDLTAGAPDCIHCAEMLDQELARIALDLEAYA